MDQTTEVSIGQGWWRARDGQWYPPERRPDPRVVPPQITVINVKGTITRPDITGVARRAGIGLASIAALIVIGSALRGGEPAVAVMSTTASRDVVPAPTSTTARASSTTSMVPATTTIPAPAPVAGSPLPVVEPPTTVPPKNSKRSRTATTVAPATSQREATTTPTEVETLGAEPSAPVSPVAPVDPAPPGAGTTAPTTVPTPTIPPVPEPPVAGP